MTTDQANLILYRLDKQDEQLERIENHAETTNGRVTKLELWKARVMGAVALIVVAAPLVRIFA